MQALEKGAKACILQNIDIPKSIIDNYKDRTIIFVDDTILALQKLASFKRQMYDIPVIAVTGSKGKSSTVSAIYYGLSQAGYTTFLGGNITVSPLTFFDQVSGDTPVVIEFSSWQLADLRGRGVLRPHIAIITKIVPDHQNWYGDMESYVADKRLIYADQTKGDYSIFDSGADEPGTGPDPKLHPDARTWGDLLQVNQKQLYFATE